MLTTYNVANMRFIPTSEKVAEKHPDRIGTVHGEFSTVDGVELSITSKVIDRADALTDGFAIDLAKGTLTVPAGERGRKASVSLGQDEINSLLDSLKD